MDQPKKYKIDDKESFIFTELVKATDELVNIKDTIIAKVGGPAIPATTVTVPDYSANEQANLRKENSYKRELLDLFTLTLIDIATAINNGSETDPVFAAWLAGPPNISEFTNDVPYLVTVAVDGVTITGDGTAGNPLTGAAAGVTSIATTGLISGGTITTTGTITTSMATNKLIGRATAGTGVMEEITLGTNLSFTGTTLNAAGGSALTDGSVSFTIDGQGGVITTGFKGFVVIPFDGTITGWELMEISSSPVSSSIVIDTWKDTYANYPPTVADAILTNKPTLTAATKNQNLAPTFIGAGATVTAGDIIGINVDSCTSAVKVFVTYFITKSS